MADITAMTFNKKEEQGFTALQDVAEYFMNKTSDLIYVRLLELKGCFS